jgi:hypothetical protein
MPAARTFRLDALDRGPDGTYELREDSSIPLVIGHNAFRLEAVNAGGVATADLVFSYLPPPVRVVIDEVGGGGRAQRPEGRAEGPPRVPAAFPDSAISLRGRVIWENREAMRKKRDPRLQVWVNGFPHVAVTPEETDDDRPERRFRAEVLLSRPEDNEIDLRLDNEALDILGDTRLLVSCRDVRPNWRLHLLVMGIGAVDREELQQRALAALNARNLDRAHRTFQTPAFPSARLYGPLGPEIQRGAIYGRLSQIQSAITLGPRPSNDIVVLYYEGGEVVQKDGPCIRLRPGRSLEESDLFRLGEIKKLLSRTRGAKLFLLDVARGPDQAPMILSQAARWLEDTSPYGLLRFSWQEKPTSVEGSLASTLRTALRDEKKSTLEEIDKEVERRSRELQRRYPGLRYVPELTREFNGLVLGGP